MSSRLEQIRRAHASAQPKAENPAWFHTHNDLTYALQEIDRLKAEVAALRGGEYLRVVNENTRLREELRRLTA